MDLLTITIMKSSQDCLIYMRKKKQSKIDEFPLLVLSFNYFLFSRAVQLSEDDVREALAGYVLAMDGCCIDKGPLRNMTITEIKPVMAVHVSITL